jgi:hypothetical protein
MQALRIATRQISAGRERWINPQRKKAANWQPRNLVKLLTVSRFQGFKLGISVEEDSDVLVLKPQRHTHMDR